MSLHIPRLNNQLTVSMKMTVFLKSIQKTTPDLKIHKDERKSSDCLEKPGNRPSNVSRERRICAASKSWWNTPIRDNRRCTKSKRKSCQGPKNTTRPKTYCNSSGRRRGVSTKKASLSRAQLRSYMWCKVEMIRCRCRQAKLTEIIAKSDLRPIPHRHLNIQNHLTTIRARILQSMRISTKRQMASDHLWMFISQCWLKSLSPCRLIGQPTISIRALSSRLRSAKLILVANWKNWKIRGRAPS